MADLVGQDGADEVPHLERRQERVRGAQLQLEPLVGDAGHGDQDGGRPAVRRESRQAARRACGRHQDHGHRRSRPVPSRARTRPVARMPVHDHPGCLEERVGNLRRSVAIRRIDWSGHVGPHPDAGNSARLSRTSGHRAVDPIRTGNARTRQRKRAVGRQRIEHLRADGQRVRSDASWSRRAAAGSVQGSVRSRASGQASDETHHLATERDPGNAGDNNESGLPSRVQMKRLKAVVVSSTLRG